MVYLVTIKNHPWAVYANEKLANEAALDLGGVVTPVSYVSGGRA